MFKISHVGEDQITITKRAHHFETYQLWEKGNSLTRRFVSTVICYADPARDPKAQDDATAQHTGPRKFPLPRTNKRYEMYIQEIPGGGTRGGKLVRLYLRRKFETTQDEAGDIRLWRGVRAGHPRRNGNLLSEIRMMRETITPSDYSAEGSSPHCFYYPPDWAVKWNQIGEEPVWVCWDIQEMKIQTGDESLTDIRDPTSWRDTVLDFPQEGMDFVLSFRDKDLKETRKLFASLQLLNAVSDGKIEAGSPLVRGSGDIDSLPARHHSYKYQYCSDQDYDAFVAVLKYLYTGTIHFEADNSAYYPGSDVSIGLSDAVAIFCAASQLHYRLLMRRAVNFLRETLMVENVMGRLERAFVNNSSHNELLKMYEDFFYENWNTILESGIFYEFHKVAPVHVVIKFGEWFGWGMVDRAINDEEKLYNPKEILDAFEKAQGFIHERTDHSEEASGGSQ